MKVIDLRSDTVTLPTPAMRAAMATAELGDDVYGEDPTVNSLEERSAAMLGKEAALFVASGTMGNLVALLTHCGRGDEAIVGDRSHISIHEQGGAAALGGITLRMIANGGGEFDMGELEAAVADDDIHCARTKLIAVENTWNGHPLTAAYMDTVAAICRQRRLKLHVDGARLFNAAVALAVTPAKLVSHADSVQFCISKGLSAPCGSLLAGSRDFIGQARRMRKLVGGGMRQAGVLAAAGLIALENMIDRLAEDHTNAALLAERLAAVPELTVAPAKVRTNMVFFNVAQDKGQTSAQRARANDQLTARLAEDGVLMITDGVQGIRAVTHYGITAEDIEEAATKISRAASAASGIHVDVR